MGVNIDFQSFQKCVVMGLACEIDKYWYVSLEIPWYCWVGYFD